MFINRSFLNRLEPRDYIDQAMLIFSLISKESAKLLPRLHTK